MGSNRRYGGVIDEQVQERLSTRIPCPTTLPPTAWGPEPIEWTQARPPVWVWIQWHDLPAQRVEGYVKGSNPRVCIVWVDGPGGGWEIVVWRNAVTNRHAPTEASPNGPPRGAGRPSAPEGSLHPPRRPARPSAGA